MSRRDKTHPYRSQPPRAFWGRSVANRHPLDITEWYQRKFSIDDLPVATAGSCFAQYIGRQLKARGFDYVDVEPPPRFLRPESAGQFGYNIFSARYGNVYTTRQLVQLFDRAFGTFTPKERYWENRGGFVDPFRPTIEAEPYASIDELEEARQYHLGRVRVLFETAKVLVFTLGLTEAWVSREDGACFPMCPGVVGGTFEASRYRLVNLGFDPVRGDLERFIAQVRDVNPDLKLILTVSPVPLAATATQRHVVVATTYSKSVLRAAAGYFEAKYDFVDYFPSFEIISATPMRSQFYEPDMREVSPHGVNHVMAQFFAEHVPKARRKADPEVEGDEDEAAEGVVCDEAILAGFGGGP